MKLETNIKLINNGKADWLTIEYFTDRTRELINSIERPENVVKLKIFCKAVDIQWFYRFSRLKMLSLSDNAETRIDLANFPELYSINADRLDLFDNIDKPPITELCMSGKLRYELVQKLTGLRELCVYQPKDIDFDRLQSLKNIEHFQFAQGNIKSLNGIENFVNLKYLYMYHCRSLGSVKGIEKCENLKTVFFESCGSIDDIETIGECSGLEAIGIPNYKKKSIEFVQDMKCKRTLRCLDIKNCGTLPSLAFINEYSALEAIFFVDTNILDGDMTPCMRLQTAATFTKRHYNIKDKYLPMQHGILHWLPSA